MNLVIVLDAIDVDVEFKCIAILENMITNEQWHQHNVHTKCQLLYFKKQMSFFDFYVDWQSPVIQCVKVTGYFRSNKHIVIPFIQFK